MTFLQRILLKKIELESIHEDTWQKAIEITAEIDEYDTPFVALSLELHSLLWTGDKKLIKGLARKNIDWAINIESLRLIRERS